MKLRDLSTPLVVCALLTACASDAKEGSAPLNCDGLSAQSLQGEWLLEAQGERYGCDSARDNGDLDLMVQPFQVYVDLKPTEGESDTENGDEADAFVHRVRNADVQLIADSEDLEASSNSKSKVTFTGNGGADCEVRFQIKETFPNSEELVYNFEGWVQEYDQATGNLTGTGPGKCKVRGTFTLDRR